MATLEADNLIQLLTNAQSTEIEAIKQAESSLRAAESLPGFGHLLTQLVIRHDLPESERQLAAIVLRHFVKHHWDVDADDFEDATGLLPVQAPVVADPEKASIRADLPRGLADPNKKIRTAAAMAIASIAGFDLPNEWPSLITDIVGAISSRTNPLLVSGSVRCLSMFVEDMDEEPLIQITPALLPELLSVVQSPQLYDASVRRRAVTIARKVILNCSEVVGSYKLQAQQMLLPHLEGWLHCFCVALAEPIGPQTSNEDVSLLTEVLKALLALFDKQGRHVQPATTAVLQRCWGLFSICLPLYESMKLDAGSDAEEEAYVDSDGGPADMSLMVSQLFDLFIALVGSPLFQAAVAESVPHLVSQTLGYMQMSRHQEREWCQDVEEFIQEEEEGSIGPRSSGCLLLESISSAFPDALAKALLPSISAGFTQAAAPQAENGTGHWRVREAALLAIGCLSFTDMQPEQVALFQVSLVVESILQTDLAKENKHVFLCSRALWACARLLPLAELSHLPAFLEALQQTLAADHPVLQVSACQALRHLLLCLPQPVSLKTSADSILHGLGLLLSNAKGEEREVVLGAVQCVLERDQGAAHRWVPDITPVMLQIWAVNLHNPLLTLTLLDIFKALAAAPDAAPVVQAMVVPVVDSILRKPDVNPAGALEGALDLANTLLEASLPAEALARMHSHLSDRVLALLTMHDDPAVLQSCCEYLRLIVQSGGEQLLAMGAADPGKAVSHIFSALNRLLAPDASDSAAVYLGPVVRTLLKQSPQYSLPNFPQLLPLLVHKLVSAQNLVLIARLLAVCARLVLTSTQQFIEFLVAIPLQGGQSNALNALFQVWTERQLEIHGSQDIKLTVAALSVLLASKHPALAEIQVKGRRLDVYGGIRTRSRAKNQAEQWQYVSLLTKIFWLLADTLVEVKEGAAGGDNDSDGWITDSDDGTESIRSLGHLEAKGVSQRAIDVTNFANGHIGEREAVTDADIEGLNLTDYICLQFRSLAQQDQSLFQNYCRSLNASQLQAVQDCF